MFRSFLILCVFVLAPSLARAGSPAQESSPLGGPSIGPGGEELDASRDARPSTPPGPLDPRIAVMLRRFGIRKDAEAWSPLAEEAAAAGPTGPGHAFLWQDGSMTDLGTLGGQSSLAWGINQRGDIVGGAETVNHSLHACRWHEGVATDLGPVDTRESFAYRVNARGTIVGYSRDERGMHAVLWDDDGMRDLGIVPASNAIDVNERNQVVGWIEGSEPSPIYHAFVWDAGQLTVLPDLGGSFGAFAVGINEVGQVVGIGDDVHGKYHALLWDRGTVTSLVTGPFAIATAINDRHQIAGTTDRPFRYYRGDVTVFGASLGTLPDAWGINARGQIVGGPGYYQPEYQPCASFKGHAYLWDEGVITDLGTLGGSASEAHGINERGQIVGQSATTLVVRVPAAPAYEWSAHWGGDLGGLGDAAYDVAADHGGNIILTGSFTGVTSFGGPQITSPLFLDTFIAKLDPRGGWIWSKQGHGIVGLGEAVAVDPADNVITAGEAVGANFGLGEIPRGIYVAKIASDGTMIWNKRVGEGSVFDLATDSQGNSYLLGIFQGTVDFGGDPLVWAGEYDIFLVKLDPNGNHLWSGRFGGPGFDIPAGLAIDAQDNVLITGFFENDVSFGGAPFKSAGNSDIFLAKYDRNLNHLWSHRFGESAYEAAGDVAVDGAGNVYLTGSFNQQLDLGGFRLSALQGNGAFVARFDPQGKTVWAKAISRCGYAKGIGIDADAAGNLAITGYFNDTVDLGAGPMITAAHTIEIYLGKLDASGDGLWSAHYGPPGFPLPTAVALDGSSNVLLTGWFTGTTSFGGGSMTASGYADFYLAKVRDPAAANPDERAWESSRMSATAAGTLAPGVRLAVGPNPFRDRVTLRYAVTRTGPVRIGIYGLNGERVVTLADGVIGAGTHALDWNLPRGRPGLYFCRLEAEGVIRTASLIRVR